MRFLLLLAVPSLLIGQETILGLRSFPDVFLSEGRTVASEHHRSTGTVNAIMLFASFTDGKEDQSPQEVYKHLAPNAIRYFNESSYGKLKLEIDVDYRWWAMSKPSTDESYSFDEQESHRAFVADVVAAADAEIDFRKYGIVYVVCSKAEGVPLSPTLICSKDSGIKADDHEIRYAVTFGNDCRQENWGWQTLVHETGHIFGLPDLYNYLPIKSEYKNTHLFAGSWDPMGYQANGPHFLAWHKYKLSWLGDNHFKIVRAGKESVEIESIENEDGIKACVLPISDTEAYVAEVRRRSPDTPQGVLIYRVSTKSPSGRGSIQIMAAQEDDDARNPELARTYITLYNALHFESSVFEDNNSKIKISIGKKTPRGYAIEIKRTP